MVSNNTAAFTASTALPLRSRFATPLISSTSAPSTPSSSSLLRTGAAAARCSTPVPRRAFLSAAAATLAGGIALSVGVDNANAAAKNSMSGDYKVDAAQVLEDMRTACDLARGTPGMADTVSKTRREMNDFVALYRRNDKVSGSTSFSTLYTAINTLSGHYASYGNSYPVPEKRKKRLTQQFSEIDRALNRGR